VSIVSFGLYLLPCYTSPFRNVTDDETPDIGISCELLLRGRTGT
jgi:hypothetical protein